MSSIPASEIVNVTPNVLAAGGSALDLIGLLLTDSTRVPIAAVQPFANAPDVGAYFGAGSTEKALADIYFAGFDDSTVKPGSVLFAQYPQDDVGAYLRGGNISALTLTQLQALNGTLSVSINAVVKSGSVNLAAATSFSNAAQIIGDTLDIEGSAGAAFTAAISGTTMTVSAVSSGTLAIGQLVNGAGTTAGTYITALGSGTGGTGTYTVSVSQTVGSEAMTTVTVGVAYDSVSGGFKISSNTVGAASTIAFATGTIAASLKLTSATGAVLSQGADAAVPADFMDAITNVTQNWATFMTTFDPDDVDENTVKLAFAAWCSSKNDRFEYVCWDTDESPTVTVPATTSLGYLIAQGEYSGTELIFAPDAKIAAFQCGSVASIDFEQLNGRTTMKFRKQAGLTANVSDASIAANLAANGYNYYGVWGTANEDFTFFANGVVSGEFLWVDSYVNQIWLNTAMQLALMVLLTSAKSIPYNVAGYTQIEAALADPINAALNFGAIRAGVTLSASQIAQVNSQAGVRISDVLSQRGWYLQVLDASAQVRAARGSPPCTLWYMDGESVQSIDLASIAVL